MSRQANIKKDVPISKIRSVKRDLRRFVDLYDKIEFIEEIYNGMTIKEAMEKRGKSPQTGYKWLKDWNEKGLEGLLRKEGSGRNSKLSHYQFEMLMRNISNKGLSSVSEIKKEIQSEFGVTYSDKHLKRLINEFKIDEMINSDEE